MLSVARQRENMARRSSAKSLPFPPEERGFLRRIGGRAGFAIAAIGLVFAAYQVQGWKMPRLLAAVLIAALLAVAGVAILSIVWEGVKEVRRWREERETSTAWIAAEPPGLVDYGPDMNRANKKFLRQMAKLTRDTKRVGVRMGRHAKLAKVAQFFGPRAAQIWANHAAKGILGSAAFIEKRTGHLRATIAESTRAQEGHLVSLPAPANDEERVALGTLRESFVERSTSTAQAIASVEAYRNVVRIAADENLSRTLRVASNKLADQLDAMSQVLRRSLRDSQRLEVLCEQKAKS